MKLARHRIFLLLFAFLFLSVPLSSQTLVPKTSGVMEEEVRQFLDHYKNRYTRKDINGFIALFSSKAIQNERDGFDDIKKIYSDFFHQSKELRYNIEDIKITIYREVLIFGLYYERAISVEALYSVEQILKKTGEKKVWAGPVRWILIRENGALRILSLNYKHQNSR